MLLEKISSVNSFKWLLLILLIKLPLFLFFANCFHLYWPSKEIFNNWFIISGDTGSYYTPIEDLINGMGYTTACRMPGLLPIYGPLLFLLGIEKARICIIFLQFTIGIFSVYSLGKISELLFGKRTFIITLILYSISSFSSIWDHFGLSDSFSNSFLIFSVYFALMYRERKNAFDILLCSFFITWSLFLRPINIVVVPILYLIIVFKPTFYLRSLTTKTILYSLPLLFSLSIWINYNFNKTNRFIILQDSFENCYSYLSKPAIEIRKLIIAWGGDIQEWNKNSAGEWFFVLNDSSDTYTSFASDFYTTAYNLDSLKELRKKYFLSLVNDSAYDSKTIAMSQRFLNSYKKEYAFNYYFTNKVKLFIQFVFPMRHDNIPFPKLSEMAWYHKVIKGGYLVLLNLVSALGFMGIFITLIRYAKSKNYLLLIIIIPLLFIFILSVVFGYLEQRYYVPAYIFMCLFSSVSIEYILTKTLPSPKLMEKQG